jgi:hypothetical protein
MPAMSQRKASGLRVAAGALAAGLALLLSLAACGGGAKQADSPGNCPEGTVLIGSNCVPESSAGSGPDDSSSSSSTHHSSSSSSTSSDSTSSSAPSGPKAPYDKDSVEIELKRAARQVKANCGSATDDNGSAPGPWGKTTASVTLGRNGHVKEVSLPSPYDSAPDGLCAVNAFKKIQFPPYASSSDVVLDWEIELVKPKH